MLQPNENARKIRVIVAVAHSGQGVFTDQLARHKAVGNVVELLEQDAAEHGQAELPQHLGRGAHGQVFVHVKKILLNLWFSLVHLSFYCPLFGM